MAYSIDGARRGISISRIMLAACLLTYVASAHLILAGDLPKEEMDGYLAEQLALAKQGNVRAKYELFTAYRDGTHGVKADLRQADQWLGEIVRGLYLVSFAPTNGFSPKTPLELIAKFDEHSALQSGRDRVGGASFFRTKRQGETLIGSFLTETPDKMVADIKSNPHLTHLWTAEVTPGIFVMHESSKQESLATAADDSLAGQLREAKAGDYWAKYKVWAAYHKGDGGAEEARKWLEELVKDAYLATFRPVKGFAPRTPGEFLAKFNEHSTLGSEPRGLGGASFFRTRAKDGVLIGSFLTAYPDKMRQAIAANPSLELISIEKLTPEMFISYDASPQESLPDEPQAKAPAAKKANASQTPAADTAKQPKSPKVEVTDLKVGTGAVAEPGKTVVVHYRGTLTDGTEFDSSRKHGVPFDFKLGAGHVIAGWEQGIQGMKVGGRRKLVIPPQLAYGERGAGNVIPPNATLVFEVELLEVK